MNADVSLAVGLAVTLLALGVAGFTVYRYRGVPMTREEMLEKRIEDLEATVRILQERIRDLEEEVEHYKQLAGPSAPRRRTAASPKAKRLTSEQLRDLRKMLLDTYTTHSQWQTLLGDIDRQIDTIATGESLADVASKVLTRANNEGWIDDLIKAAAEGRPDLTALQTLAGELLRALK